MSKRMTDERLTEFEANLKRFGARFTGQEQRELLQALKAERAKVDELEAQGAVDRSTCRWCGTIHARKMNSLCPLTIAESKLATLITELCEMAEKWESHEDEFGTDGYSLAERDGVAYCRRELSTLLEKHNV